MPSIKQTWPFRLITFLILIGLTIVVSPTAVADYEKVARFPHEFFDVDTTFRQKGTNLNTVGEGYLEISLKISNWRPRFNPFIIGEGYTCTAEPWPNGNTYFTLHHNIDIFTTDFEGSGSGPNRSGRHMRLLITVKLSQTGVPLLTDSNDGNTEVQIDEENTKTVTLENFQLREKFTLDGQILVSKPFIFPVYAGETFLIEQETYALQNFRCTKRGIGGNDYLGKKIEVASSLTVERKYQDIIAEVPVKTDIANKAERILFASTSKLPVIAIEKTPNTCIVDRDMVYLRSIGICIIEFSQAGNAAYLPAQTILRELRVLNTQTVPSPSPSPKVSLKQPSIKCVKGKSTLTVIGKNPKCPSGYKKK